MDPQLAVTKTEVFLAALRRALDPAVPVSPEAQRALDGAAGADALIRTQLGPEIPATLVLRHPLSGQPVNLGRSTADLCAHSDTLEQAISQVQGAHASNPQATYLALWRTLPAVLKRTEAGRSDSLGALWDVIPADPLMPSHTMWDRASAAAALAGALPAPALLIFTIASVQEFIGLARRTQDFWMGSYLISYLMWQAMRCIVEELGPDAIIMPDLRGHALVDLWLTDTDRDVNGVPDLASGKAAEGPECDEFRQRLMVANFPNIFSALVPEGRAVDLAKKAEQAITDTLEIVIDSVRKYVEDALIADMRLPERPAAVPGRNDPVFRRHKQQQFRADLEKGEEAQ